MEVPARLPKLVLDAERIEQVLVNLVGNALKFTPAGGSVVAWPCAILPETQSVQVSVRDTGIGIAPEAREKIFDEFAQIHQGMKKRQREGCGLGLAIARRIVEAHQGVLRGGQRSRPGQHVLFHHPGGCPGTQGVTSAVSA